MADARTYVAGEVADLLSVVGDDVRVLRQVERRLASAIAPGFTIFDFVRTDEVGLSMCFASLLDPQGRHGQGAAYLHLFLSELGCKEDDGWYLNLDAARVAVEARANELRRFDIEILLGGRRAIVIENKPWAGDQPLQLSDYARQLSRTCTPGGWKLVYVSSGAPSEVSISSDEASTYQAAGNLKLISFHALARWLGLCAQCTKPIAVRLFIEQLEQFIRKTLCGEADMSETETIKQLVLKSEASLRAALLVGSSINAVKFGLLIDGFKAPLGEALATLGMHLDWEPSLGGQGRHAGFGIKHSRSSNLYLRFEFEQSGLNGLFWGVFRANKIANANDDEHGAEALRTALSGMFGSGRSSPAWLWHSDSLRALEQPGFAVPLHWQHSEVAWLGMQARTLHQPFVTLAQMVYGELAGTPNGALLGPVGSMTAAKECLQNLPA